MKKKASNKKLVIVMLVVLLLALAVGYAAFSDILTISGTANAKGTFDLEFQNAEVVKNIGADTIKTTAEISGDKNTLTVNVADLSYPGAGVEFAVDIVNVGTMPAEIQAVTPNNITGSDKIKVTGLDVIKTDHPKLEVGDRCNIHFTVEWPLDGGEIPESESSISFGLQIEYTQSTGETFDGEVSHEDLKEGEKPTPKYTVPTNLTATYGDTLADVALPEQFSFQDKLETSVGNSGVNKFKVTYTPTDIEKYRIVTDIEVFITVEKKVGKLENIIDTNDYGKSINYVATVKNNETNENEEVSNWKVLYKDESYIYIILDYFLKGELVPAATGLDVKVTSVYSQTSRDVLLNRLTTTSYWNEFANGISGAVAQGAPDLSIIIKSYNEKYKTNLSESATYDPNRYLNANDKLYVPNNTNSSINYLAFKYWLANVAIGYSGALCIVNGKGLISNSTFNETYVGIRPVVKIPVKLEGAVGENVEIK